MRWRLAHSLKLRATLLVVVAVAALWLIAAALTWRAAEHEAAEVFDGHLAQAASMLIAQTAVEVEIEDEHDDAGDERHAPLAHRYARKVAFQVWEHGDTLLVHSQNAPSVRLGAATEGFSDSQIDGRQWRVFSAWNGKRKLLIQVGELAEARQDMAGKLAFGLLTPLLWALPLLGLLAWWAVAQALRPLTAIGEELAARSPDRLDRLELAAVPSEVEPLVERLNALLGRVESALGAEKRFTGDAAHELRTPIAALSAQAQVALAETDPVLRRSALSSVLVAAERMSRLVDQLLTLARADSALAADWPQVDLAELAREVVADRAPDAFANQVELEFDAPDGLLAKAERGWLAILLRNLIDNAVRHSPPGGVVRVALQAGAGGVRLDVSDQGAGVPASLLPMLGQRFWRGESVLGRADTGSGLGLSIVRRIAELHGATVSFAPAEGGGLNVALLFPHAA